MTELNDQPENKNHRLSRRQFMIRAGIAAGAYAGITNAGIAFADAPTQDTVMIRAMIIQPARQASFEAIMPPFAEAHPNIQVEFVPIAAAEWGEFLSKVSIILASGQQLDSLELSNEGFQLFVSNGVVRKLDDIVQNDPAMQDFFSDVNPAMIESQMYEGSLYNLPFLWAAAGINYNKKLFDQAGVDYPTNDWTVEEFEAAAKAISALGDDVYGYAWPNRQWGGFVPWSFVNGTTIIETEQSEGGEWLWDTFYSDLTDEQRAERGGGLRYLNSVANSPENVEALAWLQKLAFEDDAAYMVGPGGLPDLWAAFSTDKLGMMVSHRAWISRFNGAGMSPDDYDVVFHPKWISQKSQFGASGLAVTTLSQHPEEAVLLLQHLTSPETQSAFIAGGVHTASRRSVTNDPALNEDSPSNWQAYYAMLDDLPSAPVPAPPQNTDFTTSFTKWIGTAMNNEATAQEALDALHEELTAILGM